MNPLFMLYIAFCVIQFVFFSLTFLMYRGYGYPIGKILLLSITPIGWILFLLAGYTNSSGLKESKSHKALTDWLYKKK